MNPTQKLRVTVWNEYRHEKRDPAVASLYPQGIHVAIADFLKKQPDFSVSVATQDEPEHGLPDGVLNSTDVLLWWGHLAHHEVKDEIAEKVYRRVMEGMGFIVLHSANSAKPFRRASCDGGCACTSHRHWYSRGLGDQVRRGPRPHEGADTPRRALASLRCAIVE